MGLIQPFGPSWAYCTHNMPTDLDPTAIGATCTSGTEDSDGSAVALLSSALSHDVEYLKLTIEGSMPASGNNDVLMDLLIDPAGGTSWSELIDSLIVGATGGVGASGSEPSAPASMQYDFPLWIPSGAALGVRARSAHTSAATLQVGCFAFGGNKNPASWWAGQRVSSIGINASSSTGTAHTAGNSGAFSSWANLGSTLGADAGAFQFGVNGTGSGFYSPETYWWEFGVGDIRIGPPIFKTLTSSEVGWQFPGMPIFQSVPAGSQMRVRATCSGFSQALGAAAYAVH